VVYRRSQLAHIEEPVERRLVADAGQLAVADTFDMAGPAQPAHRSGVRIVLGQLGDAFLTRDGPTEHVTPGGIGQRPEHPIQVDGRLP
jgi:hypothetical protein